MLIEDDNSKYKAIISHLKTRGFREADVIRAKNMTDFAAGINSDIGLFIIDFKLPSFDNGNAVQNGKAILEVIIKAGKTDSLLLAISSYPDDFPELRAFYESHGCILADYKDKVKWQSTLDHLLIQIKKNLKFDFVIFCALQEERNPYVTLISGRPVVRSGIDCYDIDIGDKKGTVVLMPQMGLVNAAITVSLCIDRFKPSVVGMSGICGGFENRAKLGQLFVSSMAYEYQSGKWASDGFRHEPYQVSTDHVTVTKLRALINKNDLVGELERGFGGIRPSAPQKPEMGIFTSGSAVIADKELIKEIETIHRKVNALDMEVFAVHRAAELSPFKPPCICAKTVVDLCGPAKNDEIHSYGSYISAKFLIQAIEHHFI
jgi:nucleoside phosphorylase